MTGLRARGRPRCDGGMKLICHPLTAEAPTIRPAGSRRDWMDATPESSAYRCLPLALANQHGWEVFTPTGLTASWNGGERVEDVTEDDILSMIILGKNPRAAA